MDLKVTERHILALILVLFCLLGFTYALVTPAFEASDELWHYPMIRHLADGNPLPVQVFDPAQAGPWNQEASQPPLYYYLGALLTFWVDTADMEQIRWLNPHADGGILTVDGNINLTLHDPTANPRQGTLLAVRLVRFFSVFLGTATVYLTYRIAQEVVPNRPEIALGAAAANAFLPMFLFISGAVNNDNLIIPLASLSLLMMIQTVTNNRQSTADQWSLKTDDWLLGIIIGLACLTKISGVGLLALAWGTIWIREWRRNGTRIDMNDPSWRKFFKYLIFLTLRTTLHWLWVLLPVLLIAGWWYYRNIVLYGDWKGWNAFIAVLGKRPHEASLAQLWDERWGFMLSYWGLFGGVNVPMATWIYQTLNSILVVAVCGFPIYIIRAIGHWRLAIRPFNLPSLISNLLNLIERHFPLVICLIWSFAIVAGLMQWATTTWSSQGRLVFTALSSLSVLMVVGLVGWMPQWIAKWVIGGLSVFLFGISAVAPLAWIRPAYQPPTGAALLPNSVAVNFSGQMQLVGYEVLDSAVSPGGEVWVKLEWEALTTMEQDWSVFVHLNDPVLERPIAQRDMYLGQGLLATRLLQPGQRVVNTYLLRVPETAVAPAELELIVGLYDFYTSERLAIAEERGSGRTENILTCSPARLLPCLVGANAVTLARVSLTAVPNQYPNPLAINFEDEVELVGYEVNPRRTQSGETVNLTLYWRAKRSISTNYTFFAQVLDNDTTRWASLDMNPPVPTSAWREGEVQSFTMPLLLGPDTPPDIYPIVLGLYTRMVNGGFERLQLVTADGRITQDDFLKVTLLRVD